MSDSSRECSPLFVFAFGLAHQIQTETLPRAAADHYDEHPGHSGPETMSDIYRTIERLALAIQKQRIADSSTGSEK